MNAWQRQPIEPMSASALDPVVRSGGRRRAVAVFVTAVAVGSSLLVASPASAAELGAPMVVQDDYVTDEDTVLVVGAPGVLENDDVAVIDPTVTFSALELVSSSGVNPDEFGELTATGGGGFQYAPGADFQGIVTFTYVVNDGDGDSDRATVTITVSPVNDGAPVGTPDSYAMTQGAVLSVSAAGAALLSNDNDVDADVLHASPGSVEPSHGSVSINDDGSFVYTPAADFSGTDTFTYDVSDGVASEADVPVTITVRPLPITIISAGPSVVTNDRTAQFTVTSNRADATIQCSIDGGPFSACASPMSFSDLSDGPHTFSARSLTLDGLLDVAAPSWTWTVDTTAPVLTLASPAAGSAFTQGQTITPSATCVDNGADLVPVLGPVDTTTVGASFLYSASCTDAAGNTVTATANYSVIAPPVVEPPAETPAFDVRWRSGDDHSTDDGSGLVSLDGAQVRGRGRLILTDAAGVPVSRDRSIRITNVRIVDAMDRAVADGSNRWSGVGFGRLRHRSIVIDTSRWRNGSYRLEASVVGVDGTISVITSTFDVANAPRRQHHHGWGCERD